MNKKQAEVWERVLAGVMDGLTPSEVILLSLRTTSIITLPGDMYIAKDFDRIMSYAEARKIIDGLERFYELVSDSDIEILNESSGHKTAQKVTAQPSPDPGYIYLIVNDREQYKVGYSKTPAKRIEKLEVVLPWPIEVLHLIPTNHMRLAEKQLHERYAEQNARGEWYWLDDNDVADITSLKQIIIDGIDPVLPEVK